MRLIDMVRTGQFTIHPDVQGTLQRMGVSMVSLAKEAVPIEITNIVDWIVSDWWVNTRCNAPPRKTLHRGSSFVSSFMV